MRKGKIYIGTSGWHYKHWKGNFYPADIKQAGQFAFYQQTFKTVELNNSFYRLPPATTFDMWRKTTPKGFIFSVKGSRFLTHMKKLSVGRREIMQFMRRAFHLEDKLGPVLFQLPPHWKVNTERLKQFLSKLPPEYRFTFELRNHTWYNGDVYSLLKEYNCAFCIYELEYHMSPIEVTADFVYIRLHGPGNKYQGSYSDETLQEWANRCKLWQKQGKDTYIYFDNDQEGYAAFNAKTLQEMVLNKK